MMPKLIEELDRYFRGDPVVFSVPLDPESGTPFQRHVWDELRRIPWGQTRSYGDIASAVGKPGAARAVGSANRANQIPILIPCHRVIKADGSLGGYASGTHIKKRLLELEQVRL
jgi:O-6-methylguanine DNA methyltransferase